MVCSLIFLIVNNGLDRVNNNRVLAVGFSHLGHRLMEKPYLLTFLTDMSTFYGKETII